ncbi:ImmA/IrrE family metallo-endopeptidase [Salinibacter sp.]|uniref:ImmA/IrrE family metallo-endopeptidase n=1 Tax=Salinibacter sp. TaxID=2065818 RepID=UPI0021E79924|nr:hypothetical protein [Salinibacter sp.]
MFRPAPSSETGSSTEDCSLAHEEPEDRSEVAALNQLFRRSARYRRAEEYKRFLDFVGQFPQYSPYNAALLHVQNPGISFTATRRQWRERFDRVPEPGARPYVILQPFGPVLFVYDLPDTEPRSEEAGELPEKVTDPFAVEGQLSEDTWTRTLQNCREKEKVAVRRTSNFHRRHGGRVEGRSFQSGPQNPDDCLYRVVINKKLEREEQYGALAHELGHLFCGHLGADDGAWWDACPSIDEHQKEIETESVAYLACRRAGLHSLSERYLHWHAERATGSSNGLLPPVRLRSVLDAVSYVESMGKDGFQSKRDDNE